MSFHDDLVEARRRGQAAPTPPPSTAAPVIFYPLEADDLPVSCGRCGAVVPEHKAPLHADWHAARGD